VDRKGTVDREGDSGVFTNFSSSRMDDKPLLDGANDPLNNSDGDKTAFLQSADRNVGIRKRHILTLMIHLGLANVYAMRVNLSLAVDAMQDRFHWSNLTQGYVLSSFFWGYLFGQIPGGYMAIKYGGKHVFGTGILCTAIFTLLLPLCAPNLSVLYTLRAVMGLCESVTFPAAYVMASHWFPSKERSQLLATMTAGAYIGTAIAFPISGMIVDWNKDDQGIRYV
jgi:MFS family permease